MIEIRPGDSDRDPDGVRVVPRGKSASATRVYQGVALLLVSICAGYLFMPSRVASKPEIDERQIRTEQLDGQIAAAMAEESKAGIAATPGATGAASPSPVLS